MKTADMPSSYLNGNTKNSRRGIELYAVTKHRLTTAPSGGDISDIRVFNSLMRIAYAIFL